MKRKQSQVERDEQIAQYESQLYGPGIDIDSFTNDKQKKTITQKKTKLNIYINLPKRTNQTLVKIKSLKKVKINEKYSKRQCWFQTIIIFTYNFVIG